MADISINTEELVQIAKSLKNKSESIISSYKDECLSAIYSGTENIDLSNTNAIEFFDSLTKLYDSLSTRLNSFSEFLLNDVAPQYEATSRSIVHTFNKNFADELSRFLNVMSDLGIVSGRISGNVSDPKIINPGDTPTGIVENPDTNITVSGSIEENNNVTSEPVVSAPESISNDNPGTVQQNYSYVEPTYSEPLTYAENNIASTFSSNNSNAISSTSTFVAPVTPAATTEKILGAEGLNSAGGSRHSSIMSAALPAIGLTIPAAAIGGYALYSGKKNEEQSIEELIGKKEKEKLEVSPK